jgi:uncharacterized protein
MRDGLLANTGPFAKLMFSAFIILACFLLTLVGGLFLAAPIFGMGFTDLVESLTHITHPDYENLLKYFQVVQSIGLFVIPPFILAWFFGRNSLKYLQIDRGIGLKTIVLTAFIMISAVPLINLLAHLNAQMSLPDFLAPVEQWMKEAEEAAQRLTETFLAADTLNDLMLNILIIAVIPAVGEELLFRGIIQRLFCEWTRNHHAGIWISAIIFSALHLQFYGFLPRTILGALFGYMLVWSGKMWIPITAHFVNNAMAVIIYYFVQRNQIGREMETIGADPAHLLFVVLSVSLFLVFMIIFYQGQKRTTG